MHHRPWRPCRIHVARLEQLLVDECDCIGPMFFEGVDRFSDRRGLVFAGNLIFVFFRVHSTLFDVAQADVNDAAIVQSEGCQSAAICCRFSSRSLVVVLPYFVMNQSNMCRKTVFGCFIRIGLYISRIAFGRFARKTSDRAAFMVMMFALVFFVAGVGSF